jgi:hypothetical protein
MISINKPSTAATLQAVTAAGNTTNIDVVVTGGAQLEALDGPNFVSVQPNQIIFADPAGGLHFAGLSAASPTTANRNLSLPDKNGTLAILGDIPASQDLQSVLTVGNTSTTKGVILTDHTYKSINGAGTRSIEIGDSNINLVNGNPLNLTAAAQSALHTATLPNGSGEVQVNGVNIARANGSLTGGSRTIADTKITANSSIAVTITNPSKSVAGLYGFIAVTLTAGVGFRIQAYNADGTNDTNNISSVCWIIKY